MTRARAVEHDDTSVEVRSGRLRGAAAEGMRVFRGVPYAQPPVGPLRWEPPRPADRWQGIRDATAFGPSCAQNLTMHGFSAPSAGEDCLYLNVFAPLHAPASTGLPVMVWIHGGGLFCGRGDDYWPRELVTEGDLIFVSVNYRLNVFGFFAHPALRAGDAGNPPARGANFGLMDQQLALQWVRDNIACFGGDPDNVTLAGQSGGARCVEAHLVSPASQGLFHKAIIQSGRGYADTPDLAAAEQVGERMARDIGLDRPSAGALRAVPVGRILSANRPAPAAQLTVVDSVTAQELAGPYSVGLILDGEILEEPLPSAFAAGRFHRVPVISGTTRDEYSWFLALRELDGGRPLSAEDYLAFVGGAFGARADQVIARYPLDAHASPSNAVAAIVGDVRFVSGQRRALRLIRAHHEPVYAYVFDVRSTPIATPPVSFPYLSAHTAELHYLFPSFRGATGEPASLDGEQALLAEAMRRYWYRFARDGSPPAWAPYSLEADNYQRIGLPTPTPYDGMAARHRCGFWDELSGAETVPADSE
jgi:para-nitrobenzyl esterase